MNGFEILSNIDRDCKLNAVHLPRQMASEHDWRGIGFKMGDFQGVAAIPLITEILSWPLMTTALPGARSWFRGAANVRGRLLAITDLQGFITGVPHQQGASSRILVVHFENHAYGFAVEQVLGIQHFFEDQRKSAQSLPEIDPYLPYVKGAFEHLPKPWVLLDFEAIFQDPRFYHVLSSRMDPPTPLASADRGVL